MDKSWAEAMKEEFSQFEKNEVQRLMLELKDHLVVWPKWVFRNKLDGSGNVVRNKVGLVA